MQMLVYENAFAVFSFFLFFPPPSFCLWLVCDTRRFSPLYFLQFRKLNLERDREEKKTKKPPHTLQNLLPEWKRQYTCRASGGGTAGMQRGAWAHNALSHVLHWRRSCKCGEGSTQRERRVWTCTCICVYWISVCVCAWGKSRERDVFIHVSLSVCVCVCVCEIEEDGQISVGDSHRRAASSPLRWKSSERPEPIWRCDAAASSLSFCLSRHSGILRLSVCVCVSVTVCVCVCVCVCEENVMWDNVSAGILSECVCVCVCVCVHEQLLQNPSCMGSCVGIYCAFLCVCVCVRVQSCSLSLTRCVRVCVCVCVCAWASCTVHTNYISVCFGAWWTLLCLVLWRVICIHLLSVDCRRRRGQVWSVQQKEKKNLKNLVLQNRKGFFSKRFVTNQRKGWGLKRILKRLNRGSPPFSF